MELLERMKRRPPVLWLEVSPPRGISYESLLKRLAPLEGQIDAVNLTDNSMGRVKLSPLAFGAIIKRHTNLAVVVNFSCRDRNRLALKADLLGAAVLGIDGIVALGGDKIVEGSHGGAAAVRDVDALGLLEITSALNRGDTGEGKEPLKTLPRLAAGAVANPNRRAIEREFELLERKARAGARFVITQPVFETEVARRFIARARQLNIAVIIGVLPVKRDGMATYIRENIKDLSGIGGHLDQYAGLSEAQARDLSIRHGMELMSELAGEVAGFIVMSGGGPSLAIELAQEFARSTKRAHLG